MAKLPISKIQAILALPEPQREEVAAKAVEENQTLRELQATIDAMRGDLEKSKTTVQRVERERDSAIAVLDKAQKRRAEFEHECNELRRQVQGIKEAPATGISKEAKARIDSLIAELKAEQQKTDILAVEKVNLSKERDQLTAQLADAEKMAEYQAEQRQQAQRELMDLKTQAARGDAAPVEDLTAESVGLAVRTFITSVGYLPHSDKLTAMRYQDRQQVQAFARMIGKWATDVQNTLDNVNEAIVIMEG